MVELEKPSSVKAGKTSNAGFENPEKSIPRPAMSLSSRKKPRKKMPWQVMLFIFAGIFVVFALVLVRLKKPQGQSVPSTSGGGNAVTVPTPTTIPFPTLPEFQPGDPTVYNTDPQVIQLEGLMKNFDRALDSLDYREQDLDPPSLLMRVDFGK